MFPRLHIFLLKNTALLDQKTFNNSKNWSKITGHMFYIDLKSEIAKQICLNMT